MIADRVVTVRTRNHTPRPALVRDGARAHAGISRRGARREIRRGHRDGGTPVRRPLRRRNRGRLVVRRARACPRAHGQRRDARPRRGRGGERARSARRGRSKDFDGIRSTTGRGGGRSGSAARSRCTAPRDCRYVAQNYHYYLYSWPRRRAGSSAEVNGMSGTPPAISHVGRAALVRQPELLLRSAVRGEPFDCWIRSSRLSGMFDAAATAARQSGAARASSFPKRCGSTARHASRRYAAGNAGLYLLRSRGPAQPAFMEFAQTRLPHSSRWNWFGGGS